MEGFKENAELLNTLNISLHKQNLLLEFNSKAWEGKEQATVWVELFVRRKSSGCILNLARHLTLDNKEAGAG